MSAHKRKCFCDCPNTHRSVYLTDSLPSAPSKEMKAITTTTIYPSMTGRNINNSTSLEQEYIKSLQQQVYLLELENNHLRQQTSKATELHPRMTAEAHTMLVKLRDLQSKLDAKELELYRKESNIDSINQNIKQMTCRMQQDSELQDNEKKLLMDEVLQLRKEKDLLDMECSKLQLQIDQLRDDHNKNLISLRAGESKVETFRSQLETQMDQTKTVELALADKRNELMRAEAQVREAEDKYYSNATRMADHAKQELREEMRVLRQKMKEAEMSSENDRLMRSKLNDDSAMLVRENAQLNQQIVEARSELEREKELRDTLDRKRSGEMLEISQLNEREKALQFESKRLREELAAERVRAERSTAQSAKHESLLHSQQLETTLAQKRLNEAQFTEKQLSEANAKLKKDKEYLIDHVGNLENQLKAKEAETHRLHAQIDELETRLVELEKLQSMEVSLQTKRWQELGRMADTLKGHARAMENTTYSRQRILES